MVQIRTIHAKKRLVYIATLLFSVNCESADLMTVFKQALKNDNIYREAVLRVMSHKEDIAISRAYLLPNAQLDAQPLIDHQSNSGAVVRDIEPPSNTLRSYDMRLSVTQPIFNFGIFSRYRASKIEARAALAHLNSDLQDLMLRVADAYFKVLRSEKRVAYLRANKKALAMQLYDVEQRYKAGKTTETYVYVARSSHSAAESDYISAEAQLASDREYLTQITACNYFSLDDLNRKIPLITPQPSNVDQWVKKALLGNWVIRTNRLKLRSAGEKIKQNYAGHLPTVNAKFLYDNDTFRNSQGSTVVAAGSSRMANTAGMLNVNVPIFSGGLVVASTRKAQYNFRIAQQKLDHSMRETTYHVRDSYRNIVSNIQKIQYEQDAIQSAQTSLSGLRDRYKAGAGDLTDVLNQQTKLVEAQMQYESARYDYIMNLLRLKKESGTLCNRDLLAINQWLQKTSLKKGLQKVTTKKSNKNSRPS